jgi:membrane protease YdiL (CAAX protease family)
MKKNLKPILAAIIYTLVMGMGWLLNPHAYGEINNVIFMIPVLSILSISVVYLLKISKIKLTYGKTKRPVILWLFVVVIGYLLLRNFQIYQDGKSLGSLSKILLLFISTMLVGIAEEGMYRGFILNNMEKKIGLKKALFYSSILFGLLHSVNFLAGPTLAQTAAQVLLTSAIGYVFGTIYLQSNKNLPLIMAIHGVYDFLVFSSSYLGKVNNSTKITYLTIPMLLIIWIYSLLNRNKIITDQML